MSKTAWIIFVVAVLGLLGALIALTRGERVDISSVNLNEIRAASDDSGGIGDHVFGNPDSDVVLIEYLDYQCPGCAAAHPGIKAIMEDYEDDVALVVRHFPIPSGSNSRIAAAAAEAAGLQGDENFWEMHDLLLTTQNEWGSASTNDRTEVFIGYAEQLELDIDSFQQDLASSEVASKVSFDRALAVEHGVTGTPSFYLNGENLDNETWGDEDALANALDEALGDDEGEAVNAREEDDETSDDDEE